MLKVFSAKQFQELDQFTIENEPIKSIDLMERAAMQLFLWIKNNSQKIGQASHFSIFCGIGNNGGDGLALARILLSEGYQVKVFVIKLSDNYSADFKLNLKRYQGELTYITEENQGFDLNKGTVIIDAIFGSGLNRPIEGFTANVIDQLTASNVLKIAIDMPSGLFSEGNLINDEKTVFKANITLSIQLPKLAFMFPQNAPFIGEWYIVDIGLSAQFIEDTTTSFNFYKPQDCAGFLKKRAAFSHKGSYGHALLMVGSKGKMGAAILAARACLKGGVGLLTLHVPAIGESVLQAAVPEAMVEADSNKSILSEYKKDMKFSSIGIGPGIGTAEETQKLFKLVIQQVDSPFVIDADALNILSKNKTWLSFLPNGCILSPHPGEFKRLVGDWGSDYERMELQIELAKKINGYVILKGKNTAIATPVGRVFFNSTGNPGMATGGSGDVLTGILTSFLAQGYSSLETCLLAVCLHGLAGDIAADKEGMESMLATDITAAIPHAFAKIKGN